MTKSLLHIAMIGDVMLGRLVNEVLEGKASAYPWGDTLTILLGTSFRLCNLECVISDRGKPLARPPKEFHFRSDSRNIAVLEAARIDAVSLANNHVLDYDYEALSDTLVLLDKHEINHAGAGQNLRDAERPATIQVENSRIGVLAFTDNEPEWEAEEDVPGVFYTPVDLSSKRARRLFELVEETKKDVDILIVSAHWGPNWGYKPPKEHMPFAHALIDSGADVIFGHSGHVFRGIEIYKERPILYCAGDFVDDYVVDQIERNDQSFIYVIEAKDHEILGLKLYPTEIAEFQARLASGYARSSIAEKMAHLCLELKTKSEWKERRGYLEINV